MESLSHVLGALEAQYGLQEQKTFQAILRAWPKIVGDSVAAHTRAIALQRNVLTVATSSAAWSQTLTLERRTILAKLNHLLNLGITEIRFSTAQWQQGNDTALGTQEQTLLWRKHPSQLPPPPPMARASLLNQPPSDDTPPTATTAFQRWSTRRQARTQDLPLCPHCHCPTPPGELERWGSCGLCMAQTLRPSVPEAIEETEPPIEAAIDDFVAFSMTAAPESSETAVPESSEDRSDA